MQTTWKVTAADRDEAGKIIVEPRSLADLLPSREEIKADAQRAAHPLSRREIAAMLVTGLLALATFVWTAQAPVEQVSGATIVPTAYVVPPTAVPTVAPTSAPTVVPTTEPAAAPTQPPQPTPVVIVERQVVVQQVQVVVTPTEGPALQTFAIQPDEEPLSPALLREAQDQ